MRGLTLATCFGSNKFDDHPATSGAGETNVFNGFGTLSSRTSRMAGISRTLAYQYDLEGNRTRVTHPDGYFFQYGFDGLNRFNALEESSAANPSASTTSLLTVGYRPGGGRLNITRTGGATTTIDPDNALRLESFTQTFANSANNLTNSFQYNPAFQVRTLTQSNTLYTYSEFKSRVGTYVPNGLNQYTNVDETPLGYDLNGNLLTDGTGGGQTGYTYDMENHLVAMSGTVDGQLVTASLVYDVLGRLSQTTINAATSVTTQLHYDGDALIGEYEGGALTKRYVHGDQVDEPLVQYAISAVSAATRRFLHADHQGSIIAHSNSSGTAVQTNSYDSYGIAASTNDGRFGYTGQTWLRQLGLNYYKARVYSPRLGRFLQTDPIFYKDDFNLYAYVRNDPMSNRDPTGTKCEGDEKTGKCTADLFNGVDIAKARKEGTISAAMEKKVSRYENNMSHGYRQAIKFGDNKVSVKATEKGQSREVSGNQVAEKLRESKLNIETRSGSRYQGSGGGYSMAYIPVREGLDIPDSSAISINLRTLNLREGLAEDRYQAEAGLHEGIHKFAGLWLNDPYHNGPFKQATDEILDY